MIASFSGEHRFLSNFYYADMLADNGQVYPTVEHYFQAMKCLDPQDAEVIRRARSPKIAKMYGRKAFMRPDWDQVRLGVMRDALRLKFHFENRLGEWLVNTHPHALQEGNGWGDRFWGVDGGGENWLGVLLMARRAELMDGVNE